MRRVFTLCLVLFTAVLVAGCAQMAVSTQNQTAPVEITVFAAASLQDAAQEVKSVYESQHKEVKVTYNFASSGTLQKQIEQGAPADLFISAGKSQMDALEKQNLIVNDSRLNLLGNKLVLIAPVNNTAVKDFSSLSESAVKKIAIGEPETVPAGKYAREALASLKIWDQVQAKVVYTKDVRQVLTYVESGDVEAGLVYRSDLTGSDKARLILEAPQDTHQPIVYPAALVLASKQQQAAREFLLFLQSTEADHIFNKYGFDAMSR